MHVGLGLVLGLVGCMVWVWAWVWMRGCDCGYGCGGGCVCGCSCGYECGSGSGSGSVSGSGSGSESGSGSGSVSGLVVVVGVGNDYICGNTVGVGEDVGEDADVVVRAMTLSSSAAECVWSVKWECLTLYVTFSVSVLSVWCVCVRVSVYV